MNDAFIVGSIGYVNIQSTGAKLVTERRVRTGLGKSWKVLELKC